MVAAGRGRFSGQRTRRRGGTRAHGRGRLKLVSVFPGFGVGGAQIRFCAVANRLGRAVSHVIVSLDGGLACRDRLDPSLIVETPRLDLPADPLRRLIGIRAALRAWRADALLTHNWGAIEWALANAPPFRPKLLRHIHVEDGFGPDERDRQKFRRVLARRLALSRARVVLPSRTLLALAQDVWRLPERCLAYVPNGIDPARFTPVAEDDGATIGVVAALRPEKNLARLIEAVAQCPGTRLDVVGDGPERERLAARAQALCAAVRFLGHQADPAAAYRGMTVFALSSDTEQMPLTVLEAMAAGLPVAATDVGDIARMVAPENRPFIVPRDAAALAGAIRALCADAALRRRVGAANRRRLEAEFSEARMLAAWTTLLTGGDFADARSPARLPSARPSAAAR